MLGCSCPNSGTRHHLWCLMGSCSAQKDSGLLVSCHSPADTPGQLLVAHDTMSSSLNPAMELPATNLHPLGTAALWCGSAGPASSDQEFLSKPRAPQDRSHLSIHIHHLSFLGTEGQAQGWGPGYTAQGTPAT